MHATVLCRCVVVVGMPFPNPSDPELRERMAYFNASAAAAAAAAPSSSLRPPGGGGSSSGCERLTGRQYYEGLCMKAVNQCVGRVIRHVQDYAAIVLADARWAGMGRGGGGARTAAGGAGDGQLPGPVQKLPAWIQRSWVGGGSGEAGQACQQLAAFFRQQSPEGGSGQ